VRFSLIIPSYNNARELMRELPGVVHYIHAKGNQVEVIVVNDGSKQADDLKDFCVRHGHRLINHETNLGKGAAVRSGMLAASEEIRIFTDADIPFQYQTIDAILSAFENQDVSVVVGDRRKSDYFAKTPLVRRAGSAVFSLLVDIIMLRRLGDTQCGIKAFRAIAVVGIFQNQLLDGFAADIEWLHKAGKQCMPVVAVSAEFRNAGESSVVFWKHALLMLRDVLRLRFS